MSTQTLISLQGGKGNTFLLVTEARSGDQDCISQELCGQN